MEDKLHKDIETLRRMTPQERLQLSFDMYAAEMNRRRENMRIEHPEWHDRQIEREIIRRHRIAEGMPEDHPYWIKFEEYWSKQ